MLCQSSAAQREGTLTVDGAMYTHCTVMRVVTGHSAECGKAIGWRQQ